MAKRNKLLLTTVLAIVCLAALLFAALPIVTADAAEPSYEYVLNTERKATAVSSTPAMLVATISGNTYALIAKNATNLDAVAVTIEEGKITQPSAISETYLWTVVSGGIVKNVGNGSEIKLTGYGLATSGDEMNTNYTYISRYEDDKGLVMSISNGSASFSYYGNYDNSTNFAVYEQKAVSGSEDPTPTVTIEYQKFDITNLKNFPVGKTLNGFFVAEYSGNKYAMTMYSATSTSPNKAQYVEITDDKITAINSASSNAESSRNMTSEFAGWMTWNVTRTASGLQIKSNTDYSSAQNKYFTFNNYGSFSLTDTVTAITMTSVSGGFNLKNSSSYGVKLDSISSFGGNTTTYGTCATFTFYKETTVYSDPVTIKFGNGNDKATGTMDDVVVSKSATPSFELPQCGFSYTNYKFSGWLVNGSVKQPGDEITIADCVDENDEIVVTAQWEYNRWDLTFTMEGQSPKTILVEKGKSYTFGASSDYSFWGSSSDPDGQIFSHWACGDNTYSKNQSITPTANMTFTAVFADAVTVSFNTDGGSNVSEKKALPNGSISLPSASKTNYIFQGWTDDDGTTVYKANATYTVGTENVTLKALWKIDGFTITFMVGDEVYAVKEYAKVTDQYSNYSYKFAENGIEAPAAPEGKIFGKWTTTSKYNNSSSYSLSCSSSSYTDWYLTLPRESTYGGINNYDVVLTAQFVDPPIPCTFTFQTEDGTIIKTENKTITSDKDNCSVYLGSSHQGTPPEGYMFLNWTDESGKAYTNSSNVFIYRTDAKYTKTLTAHYAKKAAIHFDYNDGTAPTAGTYLKDTEVAQGSSFRLYKWYGSNQAYMPKKEGFILMGWQVGTGADAVRYLVDVKNADYPNYNQDVNITIEGDTTFVAIWGKSQYTISFVVNGSTTSETINNGDSFNMSLYKGSPFQAGKVFAGWVDSDGKTVDAAKDIIPTEDMTFTANFRDPETFTVTFHFDGTTETKNFVENARSDATDQSVLNELFADVIGERRISCLGWFSDESLTQDSKVSLNVSNVPASFKDLHLYAKTSEEFTVTFDYGVKANPDDEANKTSKSYGILGANVAVPYPSEDSGVPERENYTLIGWATSADSQEIAYRAERGVNVTVEGSITLYAVWDYNFYKITLQLDDADNTEIEAEVAKTSSSFTLRDLINGLSNEDKAKLNVAHKTVNWVDADNDNRATALTDVISNNSDRTFKGTFADIEYTITLTNTGAEDIVLRGIFGSAVTAPAVTRTGYRFISWNTSAGVAYEFTAMPDTNITLTGVWEALDSTLVFDTNGGSEIADVTKKSGEAVTRPADPTRAGYTFERWTLNGEEVRWTKYDSSDDTYIVMPGGGATLVAVWKITPEGLAALKVSAKAELAQYAESKDVAVPDNGIDDATTEEGVLDALAAAKASIDLEVAKTNAVAELKAYAAEKGVAVPANTIEDSTTVEQVASALANAKQAVDTAKAQADAAKLAKAKTDAKAELAEYAQSKGVTAPATTAIDSASTEAEVATALTAAKAAVDKAVSDKRVADAEAAIDAFLAETSVKASYDKYFVAEPLVNALSNEEKEAIGENKLSQYAEKYVTVLKTMNDAAADLNKAEAVATNLVASFSVAAAALAVCLIIKRRIF